MVGIIYDNSDLGTRIGRNSHDRQAQHDYVRGMRRSLRNIAEFITAFLALILLVMGLIIWRLSDSPINSTFLTPYIEAGIERYIPGAHAQINNTLLTWDNADHSLALHADGVVIKNGESSTIAEVPNLNIRLSLIGLLVGQFWPIELTIDHPQLKLNRHADGKLYFAAMTAPSDTAEAGNGREVLQNTLRNLTHAYAMRHLNVFRAAIAIHDEATNHDWSVSIPEISLMRTFTQLVGDAKVDLTQKDEVASLELHYAYDHLRSLHRISTRFKDITPAQLAGGHPETLGLGIASVFDVPLSGETEVAFDPDLMITAGAATLHGGEGILHAPTLWAKPRPITSFDIEGDFDRKAHRLNLANASFDFDGAKLNLTASGQEPVQTKKFDIDFILTAKFSDWPMNEFGDLWPQPIIPNARNWMVAHLTQGTYDKGEGTFDGSLLWDDLSNMVVTAGQGTIDASRGTVSYVEGMPSVQNVNVEADFDLQKMDLNLSNGSIGDLKMQPFTASITGLSDNDQFIDIPLKVAGPVSDIIKLIDHPPLHYATAVGLTPDSLSGTAEGIVNMHFPLLNSLAMKDIDITASATLANLASSKLVKGIDLSGGALQIDLDKNAMKLQGSIDLQKIPFHITMQQFFQPANGQPTRQVDLSGAIGNDQWKMLGDSFAGTSGMAAVTLQAAEYGKIKSSFSGTVDLTGADLHFAPLGWKKTANIQALLQFSGDKTDGKDLNIKSITLHGPQAFAQGKAVVGADGSVKSASFAPLKLGRTFADLSYTQLEGPDGALHFDARGKSLDISGLKGGKDPARSDPRPKEYRLNVEKLYTSDNGIINNATGYAIRDGEGWKEIALHGLADGEHNLAIELTPKEDGSRSFLITCDDFGKMLKGLGITDTVKEGGVKITGSSTPDNPRVIEGKVDIGSFIVGKLPVLALLLNATSPFGFSGLVTDSASFEQMKGSYRWVGDEIELRHLNAAGSSVGMNIAGKVDMNSGRANLHGTMVPFSLFNRVIGSIPLLGDILTGGDGGGVLAVAYDIKGSLADPKIGVNPVSLLTPGFLRNLFFGGDDDIEVPPAEPAPAPAETPSP